MSFYKWDPAVLSVYVQSMDDEHQVLIDKMNLIYDADKEGASVEKIKTLVLDLVDYTKKHFADEEKYMEEIKFDGLKTHKIIHQQLLDQVSLHVNELSRTGKLTDQFFNFLKVWLTSHIKGIDMKYGVLSKKNQAS